MTEDFQEKLQDSTQNLQQCQKENQIASCLQCPKVLECQTRKHYVDCVYRFLNDGNESSDFDF